MTTTDRGPMGAFEGYGDYDTPEPVPATNQAGEVDDDIESEIADAIDDSLDMDWTGSIGARHVMELLRSKGLVA